MDAHDWAEKAAQQIKEQREKAALETRKRLQDAEMIKTHGLEIWKKVSEAIKQRAVELNKVSAEEVISIQVPGLYVIEIQPKSCRNVTLKFDNRKAELNFERYDSAAKYTLKVAGDNEVSFCDRTGTPYTLDQVAEEILDQVVSYIDL